MLPFIFIPTPLALSQPAATNMSSISITWRMNVPYRNDVVYEVWKLGFFTGTVLWSLIQ